MPNFTAMSTFQYLPSDPNSDVFMRCLACGRLPKRSVSLSVFALLAVWRERARVRRQLAQLDDRQLRDIGVSPIDIQRGIMEPIWRE
jgi:uncharacterized protein YjiS (DUF1127 family)